MPKYGKALKCLTTTAPALLSVRRVKRKNMLGTIDFAIATPHPFNWTEISPPFSVLSVPFDGTTP